MLGGYFVRDANGQALAYLYSRDNDAEALQAKVLTKDGARRIAVNITWCRSCLGRAGRNDDFGTMRQRIGNFWRRTFPRLRCPGCDNWASRKTRTFFRRNHIILECECGHVNSVIVWSDPHSNRITSPLLPTKRL
jgi:hypothetical protein